LSQLQSHSAAGKIKAIKNPNDSIGIRNRNLLASSAVPQSSAPRRARLKGTFDITPALTRLDFITVSLALLYRIQTQYTQVQAG